MTDKLKPCPFCGNKWPSVASNGTRDIFQARCGVCGVKTPKVSTMSKAIAAWNKRQGENDD